MLNVPITPPRVALIDERTGLIDRAWYLFFLSLNDAAQSVDNNPDVGPNAATLTASYDAALRALAQDVGTLPIPADLIVELAKQIDAVGITDTGLLSQIAEMQKQIDAINVQPMVTQSALTSGLAGGTTNSVVYQSAPSTTAFLAAPTTSLLTESDDTLVTESGDPLVLESPSYLQYDNGVLSWGLVLSDQTVSLTGAGATTISGAYPNFTISSVNTTYSLATSTVLGLIELGSDTVQTVASNAVSATASRSYALQVNAAGQGVVNVPWTDTNSGGTVTSVAALTLGTTGTDLSSTVADGTTTPVITLNVPTASAINRGALSAADWTTFNSKQPAGSYVTLNGVETLQNKTLDDTNTVSLKDTLFTLEDDVDPTKQAQFQLSGITTGTTRTYTLPNGSSTLVDLATTQTLNGTKTFSSATINNGSSTATGTMQFAYGATISGSTKTVNIATGGVSGSTTTVTFGSTFGTTTTVNGQTKIAGSFGRGAPVTKTANFTLADTENWLINNKSGSACVVTLPAASSWVGREVTIKNMQAQLVNSASSNIVPIDSTTAGTAILLAVVGNWATMVSDGTNWVIMQAAANNNLLLE